ncbi:unnamed protein product [Aureobasidium pullulans]|nr:unnamed protein product [Aureobasidium pullulans]
MAVALPKEITLPKEVVPQAVVAAMDEVEGNPWTLVSPDGTCGGDTKYTCIGSRFGDCCNTYGYCADMSGSGTINRPKATHVPWKPTVHHDPHFKPSEAFTFPGQSTIILPLDEGFRGKRLLQFLYLFNTPTNHLDRFSSHI